MELGQKLAELLKPPMHIELVGDLGGGKTALVKALAKGLGIEQTVTSPTFNIHRSYMALSGIKLDHFDLYRLEDDEVVFGELAQCLEDPKTIVCTEWSNHFSDIPSSNRLVIECHYVSENERTYKITAHGRRAKDLVSELQK